MANTDFFDDDLRRHHDAERRAKLAANDVTQVNDEDPAAEGVPVRSVSDFSITRMAKHKQEMDAKVASAVEELEKLRKRQEDLDRQRKELEDLRRRQEEYEHGKQEMLDRLNQSLVSLEKDEIQANRLTEILGATRQRFKSMLGELQEINEESWPEHEIRDELNKAVTRVEDVRMEYNKAVAKIDAVSGQDDQAPAAHPSVVFEERHASPEAAHNFWHWFKIGVAVSLPLLLVLVVLIVLVLVVRVRLM
ncbi:MAG: hypothetical protein NTV49_00645 [Kiritimatiellaeota bacterium]|nr:hypothetical protein [Kiritimatiellota bacterium]